MAPPAVPTASSEPGWLTIRLCGIASGLKRTICTRLAGLDDEPFQVEAEFLGQRLDANDLHAERPQVAADGALRLVGQLRGQLLAKLDGVERGWFGPALGGVPATTATMARASGSIAAGGQALSGIRWSDAMAAARTRVIGVRFDFTREDLEGGRVAAGPAEGVERGRAGGRVFGRLQQRGDRREEQSAQVGRAAALPSRKVTHAEQQFDDVALVLRAICQASSGLPSPIMRAP